MGIVTRRGTKTAIVMETGEYKVKESASGQGIWMTEKVKRSNTPVDSTQAEVFGKPVIKLIFTLPACQCQPGLSMEARWFPRCPNFGCTRHASGRTAVARWGVAENHRGRGQILGTWCESDASVLCAVPLCGNARRSTTPSQGTLVRRR